MGIYNSLAESALSHTGGAIGLEVKVAHSRLRHLTGLLGNADVPTGQEFRGRDGTSYNAVDILNGDTGTPSQAKILYGEFGASWRITQHQSLFSYPRRKSTKSYTNAELPRPRIHPGERTRAERRRAGCGRLSHGRSERFGGPARLRVRRAGDREHGIRRRRTAAAAGRHELPDQDRRSRRIAGAAPDRPRQRGRSAGGGLRPRLPGTSMTPGSTPAAGSIVFCTVTAAAPELQRRRRPVPPHRSAGAARASFFAAQVRGTTFAGDVVVVAEVDGAKRSPPATAGKASLPEPRRREDPRSALSSTQGLADGG